MKVKYSVYRIGLFVLCVCSLTDMLYASQLEPAKVMDQQAASTLLAQRLPDFNKYVDQLLPPAANFKPLDASDPQLLSIVEQMIKSWNSRYNSDPLVKQMIDSAYDIRNALSSLGSKRVDLAMPTQEKLPSGSYKDSCRNCTVNNKVLNCECKPDVGDYRATAIALSNCVANVTNEHGNLVCELPEGSYKKSCKDCTFSGNTLSCTCTGGGVPGGKQTFLNLKTCESAGISNINGTLKCDKAIQAVGCYAAKAFVNISSLDDQCPKICGDKGLRYCPDLNCNGQGKCGCFDKKQPCPEKPDRSPKYVGCFARATEVGGPECTKQGLVFCIDSAEHRKCSCDAFDADGKCIKKKFSSACFQFACPPLISSIINATVKDTLDVLKKTVEEIKKYIQVLGKESSPSRIKALLDLQEETTEQLGLKKLKAYIESILNVITTKLSDQIPDKKRMDDLVQILKGMNQVVASITLESNTIKAINTNPDSSAIELLQKNIDAFIQLDQSAQDLFKAFDLMIQTYNKKSLRKKPLAECIKLLKP